MPDLGSVAWRMGDMMAFIASQIDGFHGAFKSLENSCFEGMP